jgi:tripartite ATP-independent transporter DctM subunit
MPIGILIAIPLAALLLTGVPIAFSLAGVSVTMLFKEGLSPLVVVQSMLASTNSFPLLAIPFFLLAGNLMNIGGVTDRLFRLANCLVGHIRGGLAHVNVLNSMIFAGMSGAAVADAAGIGMVEVKAMVDRGYDKDFSVAVTAASSIIGPIIPPSIVMVIYGIIAEVSIGRLFLGGFLPGIFVGLSEMALCYMIARKRGYPKEPLVSFRELLNSFKHALLPLIAPVIIIGGILGGFFTATEAGCVGALYALILGVFIYREIKPRQLFRIFINSILTSASIVFIIAAAGAFGYLLTFYRMPHLVAKSISELTQNPLLLVLLINGVYVILGFFLDATAILVMTVPVVLPLLKQAGVDLTYFGIVATVNMCLAMVTPPVGVVVYAVCSATNLSIERYFRAIWPFLLLLLGVVLLVILFPSVLLFLPNLLMPVSK